MNFNDETLTVFTYFVQERWNIYRRRVANQSIPLTDDDILATHKFCNVYRVLDRGSQWFVAQLNSSDGKSMSRRDVLIFAWLYRRTNSLFAWSELVSHYGLPNWDEVVSGEYLRQMKEINDKGYQFANSQAYNVGSAAIKGMTVVDGLAKRTLSAINNGLGEGVDGAKTWRQLYELLISYDGLGSFMAQQIVTDFGYSCYGNDNWENTDVVPGPGSRRGLRRLLNNPVSDKELNAQFPIMIGQLRDYLAKHCDVNLRLPNGNVHPLSLMDVQNCLCEFDKYTRLKLTPNKARVRAFAGQSESAPLRPLPPLSLPTCW